jgi:hypothetical protein
MSAQIPEDLIDTVGNLEAEASKCLSRGNYTLAERIYDAIFQSLFEKQTVENRRIHMGAPLHMRGLSLLLQKRFNEGFESLILAYITDLINVALGKESEADEAPAHNILLNYFGVPEDTFEQLKILGREVTDRNQPFDPRILLNKFLSTNSISREDILKLATHQPNPQQIMAIRPRFYEMVKVEIANRKGQTDIGKLTPILNNLFINPDIAKYLPSVLTQPKVQIYTLFTEKYFILAFFNNTEWAKIRDFRERGITPLPFLIKPADNTRTTPFNVQNSKNILFRSNQVKNQYAFTIGDNSTVLIIEHKQVIESEELTTDYTIGLAYLVSFGEEITPNNFYNYLQDLVAYSFKVWRS